MNKILGTICCLLLISCKNDKDSIQFKVVGQSVNKTNEFISIANRRLYNEMEEKLHDPQTARKASIWQPKALLVAKFSKSLYLLIDSLMALGKNDKKNIPRIFEEQNTAIELYNKLANYKLSVLAIINPMEFPDWPQFQEQLIREKTVFQKLIFYDLPDSSPSSPGAIIFSKLFTNTSEEGGIVMLGKIKTDVLLAENLLLTYFENITNVAVDSYNIFTLIVTKNTNVLRNGETLRVSAGVGAFSVSCKPVFTINGVNVPVTDNGLSSYELRIKNLPGNYSIPVKAEYTKLDGVRASSLNYVKYTVIK